jgi:hypothetical protein
MAVGPLSRPFATAICFCHVWNSDVLPQLQPKSVCLQTDAVELHPSLLDKRLQGLKETPPANARLLSLHAHLVGLRCRYYWLLHRWTDEMQALMRSIQNRGLAAATDEAVSKANGSVAACFLLICLYAKHSLLPWTAPSLTALFQLQYKSVCG